MPICIKCGRFISDKLVLEAHLKICKHEKFEKKTPKKVIIDGYSLIRKVAKDLNVKPDIGQVPKLMRKCIVCGKVFVTEKYEKLCCSEKCEKEFKEKRVGKSAIFGTEA